MADSRTEAGITQDEPGASCSARKWVSAENKNQKTHNYGTYVQRIQEPTARAPEDQS